MQSFTTVFLLGSEEVCFQQLLQSYAMLTDWLFFLFPLPQFIKRIRYSARLVVWTKVTENSKCLKVASINGLKLEDDKKEETDQKELSKPYSGQVAKTSVSTWPESGLNVERWTTVNDDYS